MYKVLYLVQTRNINLTNVLFLNQRFNYTWWCRVKSPEEEKWPETEELDTGAETLVFPVFKESDAQRIRRPGDAVLINAPPGCFGNGAGPLKTRAKTLALNTASLITYGRLYELLLVLSKTDKTKLSFTS